MAVSRRFGHPHSQSPCVLGIPFSYYCSVLGIHWYPPGMPKSLVFWSFPPKNSGFCGKIENVLGMDSAKYEIFFPYLKKKVYPEGFTKQDKTTLRKFAKKLEYDSKLESLFHVAKEKDGTALRRLVITEEEKAIRVFKECHSAPFSGHASHDNNLRKIKERFYLACVAGAKRGGRGGGRKAPLSTPATGFYCSLGFTGLTTPRTRWKWLVTNFIYLPMHPLDHGFKMPVLIIENIR